MANLKQKATKIGTHIEHIFISYFLKQFNFGLKTVDSQCKSLKAANVLTTEGGSNQEEGGAIFSRFHLISWLDQIQPDVNQFFG